MLKGILQVDKQRTLDNKLKPHEDLKNTGKGKYLVNVKSRIIVLWFVVPFLPI